MNLRDEIEKAIEDCALRSGVKRFSGEPTQHYCEVLDLKRTIFALPGFAPVERKKWPNAEGVWLIDGPDEPRDPLIANGDVDSCGDMILVDRNGVLCHKTIGGVNDAQALDRRKRVCLAVCGFRPATLLVPPAKEPEPVPERPKMLYGKVGSEWDWFTKTHSWNRPVWLRISTSESYTGFQEVNESASDPEAVRLWKEETK